MFILKEILEALIAGIFLDSSLNFDSTEQIFLRLTKKYLD